MNIVMMISKKRSRLKEMYNDHWRPHISVDMGALYQELTAIEAKSLHTGIDILPAARKYVR